ncbi:MAG: hypothetical protein R3B60_01190 [Candidatus Paceibacterota bacterium]
MKQLLIVAIILLSPFGFSYAQISPNLAGSGLSIDVESDYISPYSLIKASIDDYSISEQTTNIFWKIDGETKVELSNKRTIEVNTKEAGKNITLEAVVETVGGKTFTDRKIIRPVYLDVIIEPQTRVPAFYLGRALPTVDSTINLVALVNGQSSNNYIYNWSLNNVNIEGGPIRGKNEISLKVPFGGFNIVTITINDLNGNQVASRSLELASVEPEIRFYEVNPLLGIKYNQIKNSLNLIGDTTNIKAEPYYLDINTYNRPSLIEWEIDGQRSPSSSGNPYEVTLARQGGSGTSRVEFRVRSLDVILQGAESEFKVNY